MYRPPLLALALSFVLSATSQASAKRPNIIFIMVDDLGKDYIGCYGADNISTPNIDGLAAKGLKFRRAWSMPQCTPTRVTLLTGQYPWRTGWTNHWDVPRWGVGYFDWEKHKTFARVLRSSGYKTAIAGKWQINDFRVEPKALDKHGFDDWCVWTGYEAKNPPSSKRYWDAYIHTKEGSKTYAAKFGPDVYCDFLIRFLEKHREDPMFLYFPMALTHGPLTTTPHEKDKPRGVEQFKGMVRYTDHLVGRIVKALDRLQIRDNTILIFTTDNGSPGGYRGTVGGKRPSGGKASKFEGGVCQPFIVSAPGLVPEGKSTDALTDFSDLYPTFVELAGAELPKGIQFDGKSFASVIFGQAERSPRDWILSMGHGAAYRDAEGVRGRADYAGRVLRGDRYKVWVGEDRKLEALYDLQEDPLEQNNLLSSKSAEHVAARTRFESIVSKMPAVDARPKYRKRQALPWDVPVKDKAPASKKKRKRNRNRKTNTRRS
ncbi:MAG: sulfatase-like hydrolase/transferase [Planctomycetota bacterium]